MLRFNMLEPLEIPRSPLYDDLNQFNIIEFYSPPSPFFINRFRRPSIFLRSPIRIGRHVAQEDLDEIKSDNNNFIKEENIKFDLYPLYINWKKIESKKIENYYFNIFKLFGYFGEAIYEILTKAIPKDDNYYRSNNFVNELNKLYKMKYKKEEIENNNLFKKLLEIKDDVISLIKNKIIIFKEIPIFLIILKFYESFYSSLKDKNNAIESLKYQFIILNYLKNDEYEIIYKKYLQKFRSTGFLSQKIFLDNKGEYIRQIKRNYKMFT